MVLTEFRELSFPLKIGVLLQDGIPLFVRRSGNRRFMLFSFHTYYVELEGTLGGKLQSMRSFTHTDGLEPYLTQIDWRKLT